MKTQKAVRTLARVGLWGRVRRDSDHYLSDLAAELALALPPTLIVLAAFFFTTALTKHPILFGSLASSAFLIYAAPKNHMNRIRVMTVAQVLGWAIGVGCEVLFGSGYAAGAIAMVLAILLLVALDVVHPPAVSTAIGFALFGPQLTLVSSFLIAVLLVAALAVLEYVAIRVLARVERRFGVRKDMEAATGERPSHE